MATNKLMEAAAEALASSKQNAPAEPMHKMDAEVVDLGGPKQDIGANKAGGDIYDKYKVDGSKSAKKAEDPKTKPSDASPKQEETEEEDAEVIAETSHMDKKDEMKKKMKEDIDALFADDSTISEDFKSKVSTIFEARVQDRISQIQEEIESEYAGMLEEAITSVRNDLTEKVDDYLSYVVEQWMADNEIAIESGLRSELTDDFIAGLRNLFAEHYIDVPAEKVDLVDELAAKVEELSGKLDEEVERSIEYRNALFEAHKAEVTREVCEGLAATQVEKIKALAESVDYSTEEEYRTKLDTIRENYFPSGVKKADATALQEQVEDVAEKKIVSDAFMNSIVQSISKTTRI
jgi:hypothetical protein